MSDIQVVANQKVSIKVDADSLASDLAKEKSLPKIKEISLPNTTEQIKAKVTKNLYGHIHIWYDPNLDTESVYGIKSGIYYLESEKEKLDTDEVCTEDNMIGNDFTPKDDRYIHLRKVLSVSDYAPIAFYGILPNKIADNLLIDLSKKVIKSIVLATIKNSNVSLKSEHFSRLESVLAQKINVDIAFRVWHEIYRKSIKNLADDDMYMAFLQDSLDDLQLSKSITGLISHTAIDNNLSIDGTDQPNDTDNKPETVDPANTSNESENSTDVSSDPQSTDQSTDQSTETVEALDKPANVARKPRNK